MKQFRMAFRWAFTGFCLSLGLSAQQYPALVQLSLLGLGLISLPALDAHCPRPYQRGLRFALASSCLCLGLLPWLAALSPAATTLSLPQAFAPGQAFAAYPFSQPSFASEWQRIPPAYPQTATFESLTEAELAPGYAEAEIQMRQGNFAQALAFYKRAIRLEPGNPYHYYQAAIARQARQEMFMSLPLLDQGLKLARQEPERHALILSWLQQARAVALSHLGQCRDAQDAWRQACVGDLSGAFACTAHLSDCSDRNPS